MSDHEELETVNDWNAVCPWCGVEVGDTGEFRLDDGDSTETTCGTCERPFTIDAAVCVTYTSKRIHGPMTEREHDDSSPPYTPPRDAIQWDCIECGAGFWLTELEAAKGCPADHPELCGGELTKRPGVVRCCRLSEDECARRCTGKPGGCDTYGEGLEADGLGARVTTRRVVRDGDGVRVELELGPSEGGGS